jgi:hypothetical protein
VDDIRITFWQPVAYGKNYEDQSVSLHFVNKDLRVKIMITAE